MHRLDKPVDQEPQHYLNGLKITGTPKTVELATVINGNHLHGPLEVWIASLVSVMDADQKAKLVAVFQAHMRQREAQRGKIQLARVVADIPMPHIQGG